MILKNGLAMKHASNSRQMLLPHSLLKVSTPSKSLSLRISRSNQARKQRRERLARTSRVEIFHQRTSLHPRNRRKPLPHARLSRSRLESHGRWK
jgi:hypothetical protein